MSEQSISGSLPARYRTVRERTEALCALLEIEDYCIQAIAEVSGLKQSAVASSG